MINLSLYNTPPERIRIKNTKHTADLALYTPPPPPPPKKKKYQIKNAKHTADFSFGESSTLISNLSNYVKGVF